MRTKTLLLVAALSAAGVATSLAQVYSVNIVGYINKVVPPAGAYVVLGNPLKTDNNSISNLFLQAPSQSQYIPWNGSAWTPVYTKLGGAGSTLWSGLIDVPNGGGGFFRSPVSSVNPYTNTFVGEVIQNPSTNSFASGYSIKSDLYPVDTDANASGLSASLTPGAGTQVLQWNGSTWVTHTYLAAGPPGVWGGGVPAWTAGDAFFVRSPSAGNWIRP